MGSIPSFVTRRLASRVTGTLGVDTSGQEFGAGITQFGNRLADIGFEKLAERQQALDVVEAESQTRKYEQSINEMSKIIRENFSNDPEGAIEKLNLDGETLLNSTINGIKSPNVRAMVVQKSSVILRQQNRNTIGWAADQQVINASSQLVEINNMDASDLFSSPDLRNYDQKLRSLKNREKMIRDTYGKGAQKFIQDSEQSLTEAVVNGFMKKDPLFARELLNSPNFTKGRLPNERILQLQKDTDSSIKGWNEKIELENKLITISSFQKAIDAWNKGDLNIPLVNEIENDLENHVDDLGNKVNLLDKVPQIRGTLENLRKIAAENVELKTIENDDEIADLMDKIHQLGIDSKKLDAQANLAEIIAAKSEIIRLNSEGKLDDNLRADLLEQLRSPELKKIEKAKGSLGWVKRNINYFGNFFEDSAHGAAYAKVNKWLEINKLQPTEDSKAKVRILRKTVNKINQENTLSKAATGNEISSQRAKEIAESFITQEILLRANNIDKIPPEGVEVFLPKSNRKVRILPDGSMRNLK